MNPWIRLYRDAATNPKVQRLGDKTFRFWINSLLLADDEGVLPNLQDLAWSQRVSSAKAISIISELISARLIDVNENNVHVLHNWRSRQFKNDVSTERVKRFRDRKAKRDETVSETATETTPDTDTDTDTEQIQNKSAESFPKRFIPPNPPGYDFDELYIQFREAYTSWAINGEGRPFFVDIDFKNGPKGAWGIWLRYDPFQRKAAVDGILERKRRGDDPAFAQHPRTYLDSGPSEWSRPTRPAPQPRSNKASEDAAIKTQLKQIEEMHKRNDPRYRSATH